MAFPSFQEVIIANTQLGNKLIKNGFILEKEAKKFFCLEQTNFLAIKIGIKFCV